MKKLIVMLITAASAAALAQSYSVISHVISGGGGISTNGQFSVIGTIGQPDAGGAMTNGQYSATGGFWSLINVVQTPGLPALIIMPADANSVKILWPDPATNSFTLQQTADLAGGNGAWSTSGYTISSANGTNSITITSPAGQLFFRLKQ